MKTRSTAELNRKELGDTIFDALRDRYELKEQILGAPNMRYHERIVMLSVLDGLWKDHLLAMDHLKEGIGLRGYGQQDPLVAYKKESFEMFEAMMNKFQEDTVRNLFRMQILGPDGTPIETREQLATLQALAQGQEGKAGRGAIPAGAQVLEMPAQESFPGNPPNSQVIQEPTHVPALPIPSASTTMDRLEREFEQRKEREFAAARAVGGSAATADASPQHGGAKLGRNDECFCGSGKKYKKCHGANA